MGWGAGAPSLHLSLQQALPGLGLQGVPRWSFRGQLLNAQKPRCDSQGGLDSQSQAPSLTILSGSLWMYPGLWPRAGRMLCHACSASSSWALVPSAQAQKALLTPISSSLSFLTCHHVMGQVVCHLTS